MNIAVIGAGAIGSMVAGLLAKAGVHIVLVGRPEQVEAITKNGLKIKSGEGEETVRVKAIPKLDKFYDLVIFTVKTQDIEEAYQNNHEFLSPYQLILTTQNGVQADNMLISHFEPESITSSIVMFGATYTKLGEVVYNFPGEWIIGKPFMVNDAKIDELEAVLGKAFKIVVTRDIVGMKWLKLFVNFNNCIPALIGKSMQETFSDMDFCRLSILLLREGVDIVTKAGIQMVSLPQFPVDRIVGLCSMPIEQAAGIINKTLPNLSKEPLYGSILQSIMRKKTSEIDFINGEVTHLANNMRIPSPLNRKVVDLVHRVEREERFFSPEEIKKEFALSDQTVMKGEKI